MNKFWEQLFKINNILLSSWGKPRLKPASWSAFYGGSNLYGKRVHKYFMIFCDIFSPPAQQIFVDFFKLLPLDFWLNFVYMSSPIYTVAW